LLFDRQVQSRAGKSFLGTGLLGAPAAAARTMALSRVIAPSNQLALIQQPKPLPAGPRTVPPSMIFVVAALAVVSTAFGGNFLAIRVVVHALPPFTLQAIRFLLAGIVLYLFASSRPGYNQPTLRQCRSPR
jgi:hypothetical protein